MGDGARSEGGVGPPPREPEDWERKQDEQVRLAIEAAEIGLWDVDMVANTLFWPPRVKAMFGISADVPVTLDDFYAGLHPDDAAMTGAAFAAAADPARRAVYDVEYRTIGKDDGAIRWVAAKGRGIFDGDRCTRVVGTAVDITAKKAVAAALREGEARLHASEAKYRQLFESIDAGFCVVEMRFQDDRPVDFLLIEVNAAFARETGLADAGGRWVRELVPDPEQHWFDALGDVARTGQAIRFESSAFGRGDRWFDVYAFRIGAADEPLVAILFNDISERRRMEQALRRSEGRLRLAMTAGGQRSWELDPRQLGLAAAGSAPPEPEDRSFAAIHPDDRARMVEAARRAFSEGGDLDVEYRVVRVEDSVGWVHVRGQAEHDAEGTPIGLVGVSTDITARKTNELDLIALNETLERRVEERSRALLLAQEALQQSQKMEAIGQLTGGVAHDFNNLLTVIRSSTDLLRRRELTEERRRRYVDAISDTADRAAKLTGQLLAFSRRQALKPETFNAVECVAAVSDMLRTVLGARATLTIEAECDACFVEADRGQFETAIVNMAVNARDAMDGEGRLTIRLENRSAVPAIRGHAAAEGDFVAMSVMDTGTGIAPDDLARVFDPFFTTKEVGKGTGLGLSQVYGFVKQSGGEIDVASTVGAGTTFTLYLPRVAERSAPPQTASMVRDSGHAHGRILVVEDNAQVGEFATQLLQDLGYGTTLAGSAREALNRLEGAGGGFDIVFSDVVMPGMSGIELARRIRQRWPSLPVVLTSGYSHVLAEDAHHGFPLLHKPYSVEELSTIISRARNRPGG